MALTKRSRRSAADAAAQTRHDVQKRSRRGSVDVSQLDVPTRTLTFKKGTEFQGENRVERRRSEQAFARFERKRKRDARRA